MEFNRRNQDEPKHKIGRPRGPRTEEQKERSRDKRAQNKIHRSTPLQVAAVWRVAACERCCAAHFAGA
eukprot:1597109-Prymnesium_polylepis.1